MSSLQNSINFSTCGGVLNDFILGLPNLGNLMLLEELAAIPEFNELLWNTGLGSVSFTCVQTSYSDWLNMLGYRDPVSLMNLLITYAQGTSETQRKTWIVNWLMENDPYQFLYTITLMNPSAIAAAQTANAPLYAATAGAPDMQQYFEQIKQSYGNSFYDQMFNHFASSSNLYVDSLKVNEFHIYGSSRLGIYESNKVIAFRSAFDANNDNQLSETEYSSYSANNSGFMFANLSGYRGKIRYEMSNHLGNVLTVVSDKKLTVCSNGTFVSYAAEVISATDYSPFGAPLAGRTFSSEGYRFGFNSMEKDDETYGDGNAYDFGARIYDSRLARWLSVDPLNFEIPEESSYIGIGNSPIKFYDPDGKKIICDDKNTQVEVLKAINSQALGVFAFNSDGELFCVSKIGDEKKYSKYFQEQLLKSIDDKVNTVIIRKAEKAYREDIEEYVDLSDHYEGLTLMEKSLNKDDPKVAKVFYSGKNTTDKDENFKDMTLTVDEIIMHELVGHGIPYTVGSDTGDAVKNENKVREQTGKKKRHESSGHKEFKD